MTNDELIKAAINKTIAILEELGFKYRRVDFMNTYNISMSGNVTTFIYFNDERRGAKLKKARLHFFNYFNCRVFDEYVRFQFTKNELELEYIKQEDVEAGMLENIMEKVQKLLALSESDNEHEAISASLKAQQLLAKYNIDLEKVQVKDDDITIEEARADIGIGNKWKYRLSNVVAKNYRCKNYYYGSDVIVFRGYRQDITIARRVYMYLFSVCKRLGKAYVRKIKEEEGKRVNVDGVYNSFCAGFIDGVDGELSRQCTELMIITPKKVEEEYKTFSANFGKKDTSIMKTDWKAFEEGQTEGKRALNAQYIGDNSGDAGRGEE